MAAIATHNLTKYYGRARGIVDVNLKVEEGEIFGFIGPNGAGKTTTIRIMLNFIFPTSGSVRVLGMDPVTESHKIKEQVGYLAGEVGYYDDMTVQELLDYSARFYRGNYSKRIAELSDMFELDVKRRIYSLSQGNRKKVGIIQALLHKPELLILDEPTSGLDPLMQRRFFEVLMRENQQGTTIFFSSHILSEVQKLCHRVAIIREGRIIAVEDIEKLRNNQFRNVRISFKDKGVPVPEIPGVINSRRENGIVHLFFNGDINELLRELTRYDLENLWLEEPTLEEVFMHYYEREGN